MREELIKACFALASRRVGALVAIERSADLDEYVERATAIDAVVSHELMSAIFHPTSPARRRRGDPEEPNLRSTSLSALRVRTSPASARGTGRPSVSLKRRMVAIIVSEERGTVSLVVDGRIILTANANELREQIQKILQVVQPEAAPEPDAQPAEA